MYPDYRDLPEEQRKKLEEAIRQLSDIIPTLRMLGEKNPHDITAEEQELLMLLIQSLPLLAYARSFLFNNALHSATSIYLYVEELAKTGNEEAQKIYDSLRPSYLAALKEDVENDVNKN